MREKTIKRFYCDHCGKGRFQRSATLRHETACIFNPARVCPLCAEAKLSQVPMPELLAVFDDWTKLAPLRALANNCPACILATIVQSRQAAHLSDEEDTWIEFNYKEERLAWYRDMQTDGAGNPLAPAF
jgi:predicted RNA-binding Zn-ribbon protein involved in translation (DUF1610 family)